MTRECTKLRHELKNEVEYFKDILANHLKTPLNAQIMALDILLDEKLGNLNKEQKELLENISASNVRILHILENILSKYGASENNFYETKKVNIKEILGGVLNKFHHIINTKEQTFIINYGVLPLEVEMNEDEISKVISNLVLNAINFSPKNSIIKIEIINRGDFLEFQIKDEGIGFDKNKRRKIFSNPKTNKLRIIGAGLGLYLSCNIIKKHKGNIKIKKTNEFGTTIEFYLPLIH